MQGALAGVKHCMGLPDDAADYLEVVQAHGVVAWATATQHIALLVIAHKEHEEKPIEANPAG